MAPPAALKVLLAGLDKAAQTAVKLKQGRPSSGSR